MSHLCGMICRAATQRSIQHNGSVPPFHDFEILRPREEIVHPESRALASRKDGDKTRLPPRSRTRRRSSHNHHPQRKCSSRQNALVHENKRAHLAPRCDVKKHPFHSKESPHSSGSRAACLKSERCIVLVQPFGMIIATRGVSRKKAPFLLLLLNGT